MVETKTVSRAEMETYVARFDALSGSSEAYVDSRLPGHRRHKINLVGMGVVEAEDKPELRPNIPLSAHGFNLGMIQAEHGNGAALHAHETEEGLPPSPKPQRPKQRTQNNRCPASGPWLYHVAMVGLRSHHHRLTLVA